DTTPWAVGGPDEYRTGPVDRPPRRPPTGGICEGEGGEVALSRCSGEPRRGAEVVAQAVRPGSASGERPGAPTGRHSARPCRPVGAPGIGRLLPSPDGLGYCLAPLRGENHPAPRISTEHGEVDGCSRGGDRRRWHGQRQ